MPTVVQVETPTKEKGFLDMAQEHLTAKLNMLAIFYASCTLFKTLGLVFFIEKNHLALKALPIDLPVIARVTQAYYCFRISLLISS